MSFGVPGNTENQLMATSDVQMKWFNHISDSHQ